MKQMKRYLVVRKPGEDDSIVEYTTPRVAGWADAVDLYGEVEAIRILQDHAEARYRAGARAEASYKARQAAAGLAIASEGHVRKVVAR